MAVPHLYISLQAGYGMLNGIIVALLGTDSETEVSAALAGVTGLTRAAWPGYISCKGRSLIRQKSTISGLCGWHRLQNYTSSAWVSAALSKSNIPDSWLRRLGADIHRRNPEAVLHPVPAGKICHWEPSAGEVFAHRQLRAGFSPHWINLDSMASPIFVSRPLPNVSLLSVARGVQLALLGAFRALQNPLLYSSRFNRRSLNVILWSLAFQLALWMPFFAAGCIILTLLYFLESQKLLVVEQYLHHIQHHVLQIGGLLMMSLRFFKPELDELFLTSLEFVDAVHSNSTKEPKIYSKNLLKVAPEAARSSHYPQSIFELIKHKYRHSAEFSSYVKRNMRTAFLNLAVSYVSKRWTVCALAVRLLTLRNLNNQIGTVPAIACFSVLNFVPRELSVCLITTYWGTKNLIHDLLLPYFSRVRFSALDKKSWMKAREGVLLGFGIVFYELITQLPWFSLFAYGIGEASIAYLITKISDPPPESPKQLINWTASQLVWSETSLNDVLNGAFTETDEGFTPIPGTFLFGNLESDDSLHVASD